VRPPPLTGERAADAFRTCAAQDDPLPFNAHEGVGRDDRTVSSRLTRYAEQAVQDPRRRRKEGYSEGEEDGGDVFAPVVRWFGSYRKPIGMIR
jgi:hypothetical protein